MLQPHWQKLAAKLKHQVQVAYWDTETGQRPPAALGEIKGTPTIKLFYPQKKSKKNKKVSVDYNGPRELKPMVKFAVDYMPNFVEKVEAESGFTKFTEKAESNGLPQVLLFSKSKGTKPLIKALSSIFRRRLLIGEIRSTKPNTALIKKFGVSAFPRLLLIGEEGSEPTVFEKKPTFNRLKNFLDSHALKKPVSKKEREKRTRAEAEAETKGEL